MAKQTMFRVPIQNRPPSMTSPVAVWPESLSSIHLGILLEDAAQLDPTTAITLQIQISEDEGTTWRHWSHISWQGDPTHSSPSCVPRTRSDASTAHTPGLVPEFLDYPPCNVTTVADENLDLDQCPAR